MSDTITLPSPRDRIGNMRLSAALAAIVMVCALSGGFAVAHTASGGAAQSGDVGIAADSNGLHGIDIETGSVEWTHTFGAASPRAVGYADGDDFAYVATTDDARKVNVDTGSSEWINTSASSIDDAEVDPQARVFAGVDTADALYVIGPDTGNILIEKTDFNPASVAVSPDAETVYVGTYAPSYMAIDVSDGSVLWEKAFGSDIAHEITTSRDGNRLFVGDLGGYVREIDPETGDTEWDSQLISSGEGVGGLAADDLGESIYVGVTANTAGTERGEVYKFRTSDQTELWSNRNTTQQIQSLNIDPATERVLSSDNGGNYRVLDESDGSVVWASDPTTAGTAYDFEAGTAAIPEQDSDLTLDAPNLLAHGETKDYEVRWVTSDGAVQYVTDEATVESNDTANLTVDESAHTMTATSDTSFTGRVNVSATYNGTITYDEVAIAKPTVPNLPVLPPEWRFSALISDWTVIVLIIAQLAGVVASRWASPFAGLGAALFVILVGWFGGYVPTGIMLLGLFSTLFVAMNLAANIDNPIRQ